MMEFLETNSLWLVLLIALIGWLGIFLYLRRIDRKLSQLEQQGS